MPKKANLPEIVIHREKPWFVTRKRAAFLLSCDVQSIDKMIRQGTVDVVRRGRKVLISLVSLQKWIDAELERNREKARTGRAEVSR